MMDSGQASSPPTIFVYYPKGAKTGGPKCLHQLVDCLRKAGVPAFLVPTPETSSQTRVKEYDIYDAPEVKSIIDAEANIVLVPETSFRPVVSIRNARIAVWWLSVDFAVPFELEKAFARRAGVSKNIRILLRLVLTGEWLAWQRFRRLRLKSAIHLAHSEYASRAVESYLQTRSEMLSDYTEPETATLAAVYREDTPKRKRAVAFNPKKGGEAVRKLQEKMPDIEFVPIEGMAREDVIRTLRGCSAYIDLGHFPGKDHLPREASRAGLPVLLNNRGAASYSEDFPIPSQFKISTECSGWLSIAEERLRKILWDPSLALDSQKLFHRAVAEEREIFERQVSRLVETLNMGLGGR